MIATAPLSAMAPADVIKAARSGDVGILTTMLRCGMSVDTRVGASQATPLILAAESGQQDAVQFLLSKGADQHARDASPAQYTPLLAAVGRGQLKISRLLLDKGAEVDCRTADSGITPLILASANGYSPMIPLLLEKHADVNAAATTGAQWNSLMWACHIGHAESVEELIKGGANVDNRSAGVGMTPLMIAAARGNWPIIQLLLKRGANPRLTCTTAAQENALILAVANNQLGAVQVLLDNPATEINCRRADNGYTPLMVAAENGFFEVIKLLLKKRADHRLMASDPAQSTALLIAADHGQAEVIQALVQGGADINCRRAGDGYTPLMIACSKGDEASTQMLLSLHADYNAQANDDSHDTALAIAIKQGRLAPIRAFINAQIDLNQPIAGTEYTPLMLACEQGNVPAVQALLEGHADPAIRLHNANQDTALLLAVRAGRGDVVQAFIGAGADLILAQADTGYTPLMLACHLGHVEIVKILLAAHAEIKGIGEDAELFLAIRENKVNVVQAFIDAHKNINVVNRLARLTPLMLACQQGHDAIVSRLIAGGADHTLRATNEFESTALSLAAALGRESVVKILLDAGVDKNARQTNNGYTPLMLASENGKAGVVKLLLASGADHKACLENSSHDTALSLAVKSGQVQSVKALLEGKVEVDSRHGDTGYTPLMLACDKGGHEGAAMAVSLLKAGAKPELCLTSAQADTPLIIAVRHGFREIVSALHDCRAEINCRTADAGATPLMLACERGDAAMVELLLHIGADHQLKDSTPAQETAIFYALRAQERKAQADVIDALSKARVTIDARQSSTGLTPLMVAAAKGDVPLVAMLVHNGADFHLRDTSLHGYTPLLHAVMQDQFGVVQWFLNTFPEEINSRTHDTGATALMLACERGHSAIVKLLLDLKADVNMRDTTPSQCTALFYAARAGKNTIVQQLASAKADVDCRFADTGVTPLAMAIERNMPETVDLLLKQGANPRLRLLQPPYQTIFMMAVAQNRPELTKKLLPLALVAQQSSARENTQGNDFLKACERGDITTVNKLLAERVNIEYRHPATGATPLMVAAHTGKHDVVHTLLISGAYVNASASKGLKENALLMAAQAGHLAVVRELLNFGAAVDARRADGATAFSLAVAQGNKDMAEFLLAHHADIDCRFADSCATPLIQAAAHGNADMVLWLLVHGADINAVDKSQDNALIAAAKNDRAAVIQLLLDAGMDINSFSGDKGLTPLTIAIQRGCMPVFNLLKDRADIRLCKKDNKDACYALRAAFMVQGPNALAIRQLFVTECPLCCRSVGGASATATTDAVQAQDMRITSCCGNFLCKDCEVEARKGFVGNPEVRKRNPNPNPVDCPCPFCRKKFTTIG